MANLGYGTRVVRRFKLTSNLLKLVGVLTVEKTVMIPGSLYQRRCNGPEYTVREETGRGATDELLPQAHFHQR